MFMFCFHIIYALFASCVCVFVCGHPFSVCVCVCVCVCFCLDRPRCGDLMMRVWNFFSNPDQRSGRNICPNKSKTRMCASVCLDIASVLHACVLPLRSRSTMPVVPITVHPNALAPLEAVRAYVERRSPKQVRIVVCHQAGRGVHTTPRLPQF